MNYNEYNLEIRCCAANLIHENLTLPLYEDEYVETSDRVDALYDLAAQLVHDHEYHIFECNAAGVLDCVGDPDCYFGSHGTATVSNLWELQQLLIFHAMLADLEAEIYERLEEIEEDEEEEGHE